MDKKTRGKLPYDATPDIHQFASPPDSVGEIINMYGTRNVQRTNDTDDLFPLIAQGLPTQWKGIPLGKHALENQEP